MDFPSTIVTPTLLSCVSVNSLGDKLVAIIYATSHNTAPTFRIDGMRTQKILVSFHLTHLIEDYCRGKGSLVL